MDKDYAIDKIEEAKTEINKIAYRGIKVKDIVNFAEQALGSLEEATEELEKHEEE